MDRNASSNIDGALLHTGRSIAYSGHGDRNIGSSGPSIQTCTVFKKESVHTVWKRTLVAWRKENAWEFSPKAQ